VPRAVSREVEAWQEALNTGPARVLAFSLWIEHQPPSPPGDHGAALVDSLLPMTPMPIVSGKPHESFSQGGKLFSPPNGQSTGRFGTASCEAALLTNRG
jgi:hypothetical protein